MKIVLKARMVFTKCIRAYSRPDTRMPFYFPDIMFLITDGSIDGQEGQSVTIQCQAKGTTVHIRKVRHSGGSRCRGRNTRNVLTRLCNGKKECSFILNDVTLEGQCRGKVGRSKIKYKCTRGE